MCIRRVSGENPGRTVGEWRLGLGNSGGLGSPGAGAGWPKNCEKKVVKPVDTGLAVSYFPGSLGRRKSKTSNSWGFFE